MIYRTMRWLSIIGICLLLMTAQGCRSRKSLVVLTDQPSAPGQAVIPVLSNALSSIGLRLEERLVQANSEREILEQVQQGKADMAIVKNDFNVNDSLSGLVTVTPLFPDAFLLMGSSRVADQPLNKMLENARLCIVVNKNEERLLVEHFLETMHVKPRHVTVVSSVTQADALWWAASHADVIATFSSINNPRIEQILDEKAFRLIDPQVRTGGSQDVDGFCVRYPQAVPFVIPRGIYRGFPDRPVRTFAIYDVLVCSRHLEPELVYDMCAAIFSSSARLAQENFEFGLLQDNFNDHNFVFPLHEGSVSFLNRNQPSFWERYGEIIGLVGSAALFLAGGISSRYRTWKLKRKDRIDAYYVRVMLIADRAHEQGLEESELQMLLNELLKIRHEAFKLLVDERVAANDAFIIFQLLLQSTVQYVESAIVRSLRQREPKDRLDGNRYLVSPN